MLGNKIKIEELAQKIKLHPNIICFCAKQKEGNSAILEGGNAVIGDLDTVGNYMISTLIGDEKLYSIFKQVMKSVEEAKSNKP